MADFHAWGCSALKYIVMHEEQKSSGIPTNERSDHNPDNEQKNVPTASAPTFGAPAQAPSLSGNSPAPAPFGALSPFGAPSQSTFGAMTFGAPAPAAFGSKARRQMLVSGVTFGSALDVVAIALANRRNHAGLNREAIDFLHKIIEADTSAGYSVSGKGPDDGCIDLVALQ